jgi:phosphohistidine phosphatase SixA
MKLYLMRHCLTDDGPQMDADRGLNDVGREQAKVMRKFLKLAGLEPDVIVCSDFARAVETAETVQSHGAPIEYTTFLRPDGDVAKAWPAIHEMATAANDKRVLVVTHSPLVQQLLASVAFNFRDELWEFHHGAIAYINTDESRFRWYVNPKLAAHLVGEDPEEVETPLGEAYLREFHDRFGPHLERVTETPLMRVLPEYTRLVENLMADSRRATIEPLRDQMRAAVVKRWRKQLTRVRKALKTHTATDYVTAAAVVATAIPFHDSSFAVSHAKVNIEAYAAGAEHASAQLGVVGIEVPDDTKQRPIQTGTDLEGELDATTVDRAHNSLRALDPFSLSAATAALGALFAGFTDAGSDKMSRADTIALNTVSNGYHAGGADAAEQATALGRDVEKAWITEDNPCETCIANEAEGYIPQDAPHDSGDFEPPAHPNCQCSEVYRIAGEA